MCNTTLALDQPIWPIAGLRDEISIEEHKI